MALGNAVHNKKDDKELMFHSECGIDDAPMKYAMFQKTNHFKEFKLVSEIVNENYVKYSGDDI